jgi:hypothetical protein
MLGVQRHRRLDDALARLRLEGDAALHGVGTFGHVGL